MSKSKYFMDNKDRREIFEDEKTFCSAFNNKNIGTSGVLFDNGLEKPVYYIGNEIVFSDSDNKVFCINKEGELQEKSNYNIIKRSIDGKDKYIVKKDENSYYRYSIDGRLIDSIEKNKEKNNYTYYAYYGNNDKEKTETEIDSENINEAIDLANEIKKKNSKKGLVKNLKVEEQFFNTTGVYINGDKLFSNFNGIEEPIKELCIQKGIVGQNEGVDFYTEEGINNLIKKIEGKMEEEIKKEKEKQNNIEFSSWKSYILKGLTEMYEIKAAKIVNYDIQIKQINAEKNIGIGENKEKVDILFNKRKFENGKFTEPPKSIDEMENVEKSDLPALHDVEHMGFLGEANKLRINEKGEMTKGGKSIFKKINENDKQPTENVNTNNSQTPKLSGKVIKIPGMGFGKPPVKSPFGARKPLALKPPQQPVKNPIKETKNSDKIIEETYESFYVIPDCQPMYLFDKKTSGGEFFNHSNFKLEKNKETREVIAAGFAVFKNNKLHRLCNSSGHTMPDFKNNAMTTLAHMASLTKSCNIEDLLDPSCKNKDGSYSILVDVKDAIKIAEEDGNIKHPTEYVNDERVKVQTITREQIIAINIKAARMKAKKSSKGHSIC